MNHIMHMSKHKQAVQDYNLGKKTKSKHLPYLIAVERMSYCILEAKYYRNSSYLLNIVIII